MALNKKFILKHATLQLFTDYMINLLKRKRILIPIAIISMLLVAFAQNKGKVTVAGHLDDTNLNEISGMASSTIHPGIYYVHNDSGDTSRFFAITPQGKLKHTFYFKGEAAERLGVRDCEDIAVGPGPANGISYIYLGDIGDNDANRKYLVIYRFAEPENIAQAAPITGERLFVKYPDGAKDAETLMVDPVERLLYIVSKRKGSVNVYTTPLNFNANDTVTLEKRAKLHFGGLPPFKWITSGAISKDGGKILLRNYEHVYYWVRKPGVPVWQTMTTKPAKLYYKQEKQGEAIAFTPDGKGYYTTSEGLGAPVYYYNLP